MNFSRVLVAIDDSDYAARALDAGASLAKAVGGALAVVHVIDPRAAINVQADLATIDLIDILRKDGRRLIDDAAAQHHLPSASTFLREGIPDAEIAQTAKEWKADVLVVGTHGRSGLTRVLLGSTAEALVRSGALPVLVVRGPAGH